MQLGKSFKTRQHFGNVFIKLMLLGFLGTPTFGWFLSQLGLNETYRVRHLSTHFTRVFLSIKIEAQNFPTLIESRWPVRYAPLKAAVFPNTAAHDINPNPRQRNCRLIQNAVWTQVDSLNRLWVMDIGNVWKRNANESSLVCVPKLLVYDLLRNNAEVLRIDCSRYIDADASKLLAIKLGPPPLRRCQSVEKYVYFLRADNSNILAYDIIEQRWQQRLLVSRKYENVTPEMLPIKPIDMAFGKAQQLLISDNDGSLFSSSNALLLQQQLNKANLVQQSNEISVANSCVENSFDTLELKYLGSLLGPSRGMMVDYSDVLFYVVPKFGAVVRCPHYNRNLTAEGNEIIYMTSKNIQQIFFGSEHSVWLVTDRVLQPSDHCFAGLT